MMFMNELNERYPLKEEVVNNNMRTRQTSTTEAKDGWAIKDIQQVIEVNVEAEVILKDDQPIDSKKQIDLPQTGYRNRLTPKVSGLIIIAFVYVRRKKYVYEKKS